MKVKQPWQRLGHFWGKVDGKHNQLICKYIQGQKILDIGCGYGSLVNYLRLTGNYEAVGIDTDAESLRIARQLCPNGKYILKNKKELEFPDASYDTVILKESLHHIYRESDFNYLFHEIRRVLKEEGRLIIFDPNPNFVVRWSRKLIAHKDPECSISDALALLKKFDFRIEKSCFFECLALPLSGGYVGLNLIPNISIINKLLLYWNDLFSHIINRALLGKALLWRYLIVANKE